MKTNPARALGYEEVPSAPPQIKKIEELKLNLLILDLLDECSIEDIEDSGLVGTALFSRVKLHVHRILKVHDGDG